ncbi:MAG: DNA-processing protein DprA [Oscillospiraceae bacterium]|nr:DNA-processing protein DprA [Oscillospiraceae bacterium]
MEYWIWLSNALGPGSPRVNDVVAHYETARHFYEEKKTEFRSVSFLSAAERKRLCEAKLSDALRIREKTLAKGYHILTPERKEYPDRLRNIYAMPAVLYVDGDLGDIDENVAIAVVGTRKCTDYGLYAAADFGKGLAKGGAVVITGLAKGIDGAAHEAALRAGGTCIAVLGCGLDVAYPSEHAAMQKETARKGAVVTEYPLGTRPEGFHFPIRNRIMSALSLGVVVVEGDRRSGALITANCALEQGKDVYAVPGSIYSRASQGPLHLLRTGAIPVTRPREILEEYRYRYGAKIRWEPSEPETAAPVKPTAAKEQPVPQAEEVTIREKRPLPVDADETMVKIYGILSEIPIHVDEIAAQTQKNPAEVLTALSELEIMGFVSANAGRRFSIS